MGERSPAPAAPRRRAPRLRRADDRRDPPQRRVLHAPAGPHGAAAHPRDHGRAADHRPAHLRSGRHGQVLHRRARSRPRRPAQKIPPPGNRIVRRLGALAGSFNVMSRQILDAREEITAWNRTLEDRVRDKTAELQTAHEQMLQAEKLTSLGKLAAVVAHEINNPLSGILTYAKLLRRWVDRGELEERAPEMRESLLLIESESKRCGDIVRSLLTFARVAPLNIAPVDLSAVIRQTVKLVEHKMKLGNITPLLELADDLPPVRGDAAQLEQLILALVIHAIEAMPHERTLHLKTSSGVASVP